MLEKSVFVDQETGVRYFNMWATHVKYLNDETERKLYVDMFLEKVSELLLSAKSSYIIIMIGPSSDFGSQPYFGYL